MVDKIKFSDAIKYLFLAKGKDYSQNMVAVWYDALKDFNEKELFIAMKKLSLNTDDFINIGKVIELMHKDDNALAEKEWVECLNSAKRGGRLPISVRAAKTLNSLGGMRWLRESDASQVNWQKKEFLETYKNTPDSNDNNFICLGLETKPYLKGNNNELPALQ